MNELQESIPLTIQFASVLDTLTDEERIRHTMCVTAEQCALLAEKEFNPNQSLVAHGAGMMIAKTIRRKTAGIIEKLNELLPNLCPVCQQEAITRGKDPWNNSSCAFDHWWHTCMMHGRPVPGKQVSLQMPNICCTCQQKGD